MKKILAILLLSPLMSFASTWVALGVSKLGTEYKVDIDSIIRNGNEVSFWDIKNSTTRNSRGALSTKNNFVVNCRTREYALKKILEYTDIDANGTNVATASPPTLIWKAISPDSVLEDQFKFVCKK